MIRIYSNTNRVSIATIRVECDGRLFRVRVMLATKFIASMLEISIDGMTASKTFNSLVQNYTNISGNGIARSIVTKVGRIGIGNGYNRKSTKLSLKLWNYLFAFVLLNFSYQSRTFRCHFADQKAVFVSKRNFKNLETIFPVNSFPLSLILR